VQLDVTNCLLFPKAPVYTSPDIILCTVFTFSLPSSSQPEPLCAGPHEILETWKGISLSFTQLSTKESLP